MRGAVMWVALVAFAAPAAGATAKTTSKKPAVAKKAKPSKKKKAAPAAPALEPEPEPEPAPEAVPAIEPPVPIPEPEPEPEPESAAPAPFQVAPPPDPAPDPGTTGVPRGKRTVAVLDVDVTAPNEKLDAAALSDVLLGSVDRTEMFTVIGTKDRDSLVGLERQRQLLDCQERDSACLGAIAKATGTDFVFAARVGKVEGHYLVTARMIDAARSRVVGRASLQVDDAGALPETVWRATQQTLDGYGNTLSASDAVRWASRPRQAPPVSLAASTEPVSQLGAWALLVGGYQPLSVAGKRASAGGDVSLNFRRGRFDVAAGVVIASSPGARVALGLAVVDSTLRLDLLVRGTAFPGVGWYGGGLAAQLEWVLSPHFGLIANVAGEAYPGQGSVIVALLSGFGLAARF